MDPLKAIDPAGIAELVRNASAITVLTGAGMSAESGIATFRGAQDSLWSRFDPQRLASPQGWREDRQLVWAWYRWRMALVRCAQPNAGHLALARLAQRKPGLSLITQNVDDLHERAGSRDAIHLHGELFALRCFACGRPGDGIDLPDNAADTPPLRSEPPNCLHCGEKLRPGVVRREPAARCVASRRTRCKTVRTDAGDRHPGDVHPAALLPKVAKQHDACVIEINPEESALSEIADVSWRTTAAEGLPMLSTLTRNARRHRLQTSRLTQFLKDVGQVSESLFNEGIWNDAKKWCVCGDE